MNYLLISNPQSGGYDRKILSKFVNKMDGYKINIVEVILKKNQPVKSVIDSLNNEQRHCIIFACGDGTINSGINAVGNKENSSNFLMTFLPMGTANVFCKELNIKTYKDTIKLILNNSFRKVHLANVKNIATNESRLFALMASVGYDSLAIDNLNEKLKEKIGKIAYIIAFLGVIFKKKKIDLKIEVDQKKYDCCSVIIQNGKYYGGKFNISSTDLYKEELENIVIKKLNPLSIAKYYIFKKSENVLSLKFNTITIDSAENIPIQIDGDKFSSTPIEITLTEKFINVLT